MTRLAFPGVDRPAVSVVMVTYGGRTWARRALEAVIENTEPCYEVIVVDNASPDETPLRLREDVEGAKVLFNSNNAGFAAGVDRGVCYATAPNLVLLNSDAMVQPGWLPPLLDVIESDRSAAAVVPMLLNLDGTLQEAGSLIGGDGHTLAWGSGDDPTALQYRFRRYIDYASAACMLLRRSAFLSVGGLDPRYPVGYYEDVDLCLAFAEPGWRVVYEPRSTVVHVRWGSSDPVEAGRLMDANRPILLRRWGRTLAGRPPLIDFELPTYPHRVIAARDFQALHRLLVIVDGGDDLGSTQIGQLVAAVAKLWPTNRITLMDAAAATSDHWLQSLLDLGVEIVEVPDDWDAWLAGRLFHYSAVLASSGQVWKRLAQPMAHHQPQALRIHDLRHAEEKRSGEDLDEPEAAAVRSADLVLCASEEQLRLVRRISTAVAVIVVGEREEGVIEAMAHVGMAPPEGAN